MKQKKQTIKNSSWKLNVKCRQCGHTFTLNSSEDILRITRLSNFLPRYQVFYIAFCPTCQCVRTIPKHLIKKEIRQNCLSLAD